MLIFDRRPVPYRRRRFRLGKCDRLQCFLRSLSIFALVRFAFKLPNQQTLSLPTALPLFHLEPSSKRFRAC